MLYQKKIERANEYFDKVTENWDLLYEIAKYLRDDLNDNHEFWTFSEIYYLKCLEIKEMGYVLASYGFIIFDEAI